MCVCVCFPSNGDVNLTSYIQVEDVNNNLGRQDGPLYIPVPSLHKIHVCMCVCVCDSVCVLNFLKKASFSLLSKIPLHLILERNQIKNGDHAILETASELFILVAMQPCDQN